jgi:hypothetical protein
MRVQSQHLTFVVDKDPNETHECHRLRAFAVAALLDVRPECVSQLDAVLAESKLFVAMREARCNRMPSFRYFKTDSPPRSGVKPTGPRPDGLELSKPSQLERPTAPEISVTRG